MWQIPYYKKMHASMTPSSVSGFTYLMTDLAISELQGIGAEGLMGMGHERLLDDGSRVLGSTLQGLRVLNVEEGHDDDAAAAAVQQRGEPGGLPGTEVERLGSFL